MFNRQNPNAFYVHKFDNYNFVAVSVRTESLESHAVRSRQPAQLDDTCVPRDPNAQVYKSILEIFVIA